MKKNKVIILASIIVGVLVVTLGLTYAAITFNETKGNSKLVLGDIYMHYGETNQLVLSDAMPFDTKNYTVNEIMKSQIVSDVNELTDCVSLFQGHPFDEGSTAETYCKGTGTWEGYTFQEELDDWMLGKEAYFKFLTENNIIIQDGDSYVINQIMQTQEVEETNELIKCVAYNSLKIFDDGSDAISYCQGTGTFEGKTYQQNLYNLIRNVGIDYYLTEYAGQYLLDNNIILSPLKKQPYFEFTIVGKNTYPKEDIWYEVVLTHGDNHDERTTRIRDELLRFTLIEVINGKETILFNNRKYATLSDKRIYVDTIPANTNEEINRTYRLYMWIDENTVIGNVEEDYTLEEWNDVFASIKVNVTGDFNEKELPYDDLATDASCFDTYEATVYMRNTNMTDEELNSCVTFFESYGLYLDEGSTLETFWKGSGTQWGLTFDNMIADGDIDNLSELIEKNIVKEVKGLGVDMSRYDFTCTQNIIIPMTINGQNVIEIKGRNLYNYHGSSSVVIPPTVLEIGEYAFHYYWMYNIEIPDSVITIRDSAFVDNLLTNVIIPDSVTYLSCRAFDDDVVITKNDNLTCIEGPDL